MKDDHRYYEDLEFRHEYLLAHPVDEIAYLFPEFSRGEVSVPWPKGYTTITAREHWSDQVHHVAGGISGNRRWDRPWNLCSLSFYTHGFVNEFRFDGLILCVTAKLRKREFDWHEANRTLGINLHAHMQSRPAEFEFVRKLQRNLARRKAVA